MACVMPIRIRYTNFCCRNSGSLCFWQYRDESSTVSAWALHIEAWYFRLVHSMRETCLLDVGEVTSSRLEFKLDLKCFLDLCIMCLLLLLILRNFVLTHHHCIFYCCQHRVQTLALCRQALRRPCSFHDLQSSRDLLDICNWFNRKSYSESFSLLSLSDKCTTWSHYNICLFNTIRHTALQCFNKKISTTTSMEGYSLHIAFFPKQLNFTNFMSTKATTMPPIEM